ncbi:MAG: protein phosphatase 2C domain-containing protein [Oscillospiraceae bacterium]|nr:protein phosphatase 2C domain-containing protein [Oscillospiraceae bacterium]
MDNTTEVILEESTDFTVPSGDDTADTKTENTAQKTTEAADAMASNTEGDNVRTAVPEESPELSEQLDENLVKVLPITVMDGRPAREAGEEANQETTEILGASEPTSRSSGGTTAITESIGILAICIVGILFILTLGAILAMRFRKKRSVQTEEETVRTGLVRKKQTPPTGQSKNRGGIRIGCVQDQGRREEQQDSFGHSSPEEPMLSEKGLLAVVADGMGGLNNGTTYSATAVRTALQSFWSYPPEKSDEATLLRVLKTAREAVRDTGLTDGGTTFVASLIRNHRLHFVSVGDSRICLMRNGGLIQLNREHVYGRELDDLAMNGLLSEQEAAQDRQRKALTSYIGKEDEILIDRNISPIPLYSGDKVILMSDGVYGALHESELAELLLRHKDPREGAAAVRDAILKKQNPHQDNLTIVILDID